MTDREAIEVFEKWKGCRDLVLAKSKVECDGSCDNCEFNIEGENTFDEAIEVAIRALKRESQNSCILDEEVSNVLMDIISKDLPERFTATDCSCLNCKNRHSVHCEPQYKKIYGYCGNWERR